MKNKTKCLAMLSTHGYFDPVPVLGQTDTGGQVVYVLELAKALVGHGYRVDIFTRWFDQEKQQIDPVPDLPEVRVVRIPAGTWDFVTKEDIYGLLPELSRNMIAFIEDEKMDYELFHGHYVDAGLVTLEMAKHFGRPSFFTAHSLGAWKKEQMGGDPEEMERKFNFRHRIAEETKIIHSVSANTVTSALQHEKLIQLYDYHEDNVAVITPGVNIHRFLPLSDDEHPVKIDLPDKYIYCLSRIDSNKGHDMLLRAFNDVLQVVPDVYLVIGGGSPKPKPRELEVFSMMHQIIDELGITERVIFVGYVPERMMVPYYQNAKLFVMPSLFEPFGMTAQESMACGVPVVASRYGGIRTVLNHGENGILIDPKDRQEFSGAMVRLLTDPGWRKKIGRAGHDLIQDKFSWEVIAGQHMDLYSRFLS